MIPDPEFSAKMGSDTLDIWLSFWELSGHRRINILRYAHSGGDPEKMIEPVTELSVIPSVRAIFIENEPGVATGFPGEFNLSAVKLETLDVVRMTDRLDIGGIEHEIDTVLEKNFGDISIYTITAHRLHI